MGDLKFVADETRQPIDTLMSWFPRIAVSGVFLLIGLDKFASHSMWVRIFEGIGFGQWFRYVTGALQVGGAVLVIIPRTSVVGIVVLASTMLGAVLAWIFLLRAPGNAVIPGALLGILLLVGLQSVRNIALGPTRR